MFPVEKSGSMEVSMPVLWNILRPSPCAVTEVKMKKASGSFR